MKIKNNFSKKLFISLTLGVSLISAMHNKRPLTPDNTAESAAKKIKTANGCATALTTGKPHAKIKTLLPLLKVLQIRDIQNIVLDYLTWECTNSRWKSLKLEERIIEACAFSPDSQYLVAAPNLSIDLYIINLKTGTAKIITKHENGSERCKALAFSADGMRFATGADGTVIIRNAQTCKPVTKLEPDQVGVTAIAFSPNGKYLATGIGNGNIRIWDAQTYKLITEFTDQRNDISSMEFSPCSNFLVSGSHDWSVMIWDIKNLKQYKTMQQKLSVGSVAWSRCGQFIACGVHVGSLEWNSTVAIWNAHTGQMVKELPIKATQVRFSSCGKYLIAGLHRLNCPDWDENIQIFDAKTFAHIQTLKGHANAHAMAVSNCGNYIATCDYESLNMWRNQAAEIEEYQDNSTAPSLTANVSSK